MCRFNQESQSNHQEVCQFQYIICVGSIYDQQHSIQYKVEFQYIICVGSILVNDDEEPESV